MRAAALQSIYELAKQDPRVVFVGSDLGNGTLAQFAEEMPARFFMEGVSEAHIIGMAAGLALEGYIPYVNTIATFLTRRCFEQCVLDLGLHRANVRLIGNGGGAVYAPLGPTHEATDDIAIMRTIPDMAVVAPSDADEMRRLVPQTLGWPGPLYIRLAKGGDPIVSSPSTPFQIGRAIVAREGGDVLLVTTGIGLQIALDAAGRLHQAGIEAKVLHCHTIKPLDTAALERAARGVRAIVTVEEHSIVGGLGSAVLESLAESGALNGKAFKRIGLPDQFLSGYGSQATMLAKYGLTPEAVARQVETLIGTANAVAA